MKKMYYKHLDETLYFETLDNGLNVYLMPKPQFNLTCGVYATKFGNLYCDSEILVDGKYQKMESGMAHFLEHRLFDYRKGNVVDLFASYGAVCNAFTSYEKTAYYFSTSENVNKCVNLLLDFVSELNVTKESVEKEKGIIIQELLMYQDNPDTVLMTNTFKNAYLHNMIKDDIGGDEQTVRNTTLELLQAAHKTFYHPSNMVFVLVGNFDPTKMMQLIRQNQFKKPITNPLKYKVNKAVEPKNVVVESSTIKMDVAFTKTAILYKMPAVRKNVSPEKLELNNLSGQILLDILFSRSGDINNYLLENKIIALPMNASYLNEFRTSQLVLITADVLDSDQFISTVKESIKDYKKYLTKEKIENHKRTLIGQYLNSFNDTERIGVDFISDLFKGISYFDKMELISKINYQSVVKMAETILKGQVCTYIIDKEQQND
jgi:predicted Zn-dependent peptidase